LWTYLYFDRVKDIVDPNKTEKGLSTEIALDLKDSYGPGTMVIHRPSIIELIVHELIKPLYILLLFSVYFWIYVESYYLYSVTLFVVFTIGVIINLIQMVKLNNKIFAMAYY
jgi:hypothetical protein